MGARGSNQYQQRLGPDQFRVRTGTGAIREAVADTRQRQRTMFAERLRGHDQELPGYAAKFGDMAARLVAYDGDIVCPPTVPDADIDRLLADGSPHDGTTIMQTGLPNRCHENTARLWESGSVTAVGTGYALSDDGMWRQHSWGLRDGTVIETTEPRVRYWGLTLAGDDADRFSVDNG